MRCFLATLLVGIVAFSILPHELSAGYDPLLAADGKPNRR